MKIQRVIAALALFVVLPALSITSNYINRHNEVVISGAPPNGIPENQVPELAPWEYLKDSWHRPEQAPKVGLQVGHLENDQVPSELLSIKGNTGAQSDGYREVVINQKIAEETAIILRQYGIEVDILPTTVPKDYWADAFIAIHADGSHNPEATGFKIAGPWRDLSDKSDTLVDALIYSYQEQTDMVNDEKNITENMRGYYAFGWWKYDHSIHPMTPAAIVETGFVSNPKDREIIAKKPEVPAQAIAIGVMRYLEKQGLLIK